MASGRNMKQIGIKFCTLSSCIAIAGITIGINFSSAQAQDAGCFRVAFDSARFGPIFYGAEATRTMSITNDQDVAKTISSIHFTAGDSSEFTVLGKQIPLTIPAHEMRLVTIAFMPHFQKPDSSDNFQTTVSIASSDRTDHCTHDVTIYGEAINPTWINTLNPFDRTSVLPTLKFSGTDEIFGQTFLFHSTDKDALKIISISSVNKDTQLVVIPEGSCSGLPMTTLPGELMAVRLTLQTYDSKVYYNQLRFDMGNGAAPIIYDIEAERILPQAGVRPSAAPEVFTFSAVPNPSSGIITIQLSGSEKADIEIFDELGKSILSRKNIVSWIWNGETSTGTPVPSGNYFIRAAARDANGKIIVSTKNVSILR